MDKAAARAGDAHTCPRTERLKAHDGGPILEGSPDVLIAGLPAARLGDRLHCEGPCDTISEGEPSVLINGRPAARMGDKTAHGGCIVEGCPSVLVGTSSQGRCALKSAAAGAPLVVVTK